jgi:hypothetical protein
VAPELSMVSPELLGNSSGSVTHHYWEVAPELSMVSPELLLRLRPRPLRGMHRHARVKAERQLDLVPRGLGRLTLSDQHADGHLSGGANVPKLGG